MVNLFEYKLKFYRVHHFLCVGQIQEIGIIQFYRCWRSSTGVLVLSSSCSSLENRVTELKFMVSSKVQAKIQMSQQNFDNLSYSYAYTSSLLINKINYDVQKKRVWQRGYLLYPNFAIEPKQDSYSKFMPSKAYRQENTNQGFLHLFSQVLLKCAHTSPEHDLQQKKRLSGQVGIFVN